MDLKCPMLHCQGIVNVSGFCYFNVKTASTSFDPTASALKNVLITYEKCYQICHLKNRLFPKCC